VRLLLSDEPVPPGRERIHKEVAGLGGTAKGPLQLGGSFIATPTRNIVFRPPKVRVPRLVLITSLPATRERSNLDRGFTVPAQPVDPGGGLARLSFFCD
jgi:hypothetical protein